MILLRQFLIYAGTVLSCTMMQSMQLPAPTDTLPKPAFNNLMPTEAETKKLQQENIERLAIIKKAFAQQPKGSKKIDFTRMSFALQKHIAQWWLKLNVHNFIKEHTEEFIPAIIHYKSLERSFIEEIRETELEYRGHYTASKLNLDPDNIQSMYWYQPQRDLPHDEKLDADIKRSKVGFNGRPHDKTAFIMIHSFGGECTFYINATNRALFRSFTREQFTYLVGLYHTANKKKYAQKHAKIHRSLPVDMRDILEANYQLLA